MRHKFIAAFSLLVVSVLLSSCDDTIWSCSEVAELNATGIELTQQHSLYFGSIPSSGGEITLTAIGKNKEKGFLSAICTPEVEYQLTGVERQGSFPTTVYDEAWGKVAILSDNPHTTRITFHANTTGNNIDYLFMFGEVFIGSHMYITQLSE